MAINQYADYVNLTEPAARLARLRLHIAECTADLRQDTSASDHSQSNKNLVEYVRDLKAEETRLDVIVSASRRKLFSLARLRKV